MLKTILFIILKILIPAWFAFVIPDVIANLYCPSQKETFAFAKITTFFLGVALIFLTIIDVLNLIGISNVVVDFCTTKHHLTLASYLKYGYGNHPILTTVFLLYLLTCITFAVSNIRENYRAIQNYLNSKINMSQREI